MKILEYLKIPFCREVLLNEIFKLANENKSFPLSHPIYIFFHYSHPPLVERLKALGFSGAGIGQMKEDTNLKNGCDYE